MTTATTTKTNYCLYVGVDIAAKSFTASTCERDQEPTKAQNFSQESEGFAALLKLLLATNQPPA